MIPHHPHNASLPDIKGIVWHFWEISLYTALNGVYLPGMKNRKRLPGISSHQLNICLVCLILTKAKGKNRQTDLRGVSISSSYLGKKWSCPKLETIPLTLDISCHASHSHSILSRCNATFRIALHIYSWPLASSRMDTWVAVTSLSRHWPLHFWPLFLAPAYQAAAASKMVKEENKPLLPVSS